MKLMKQLKNIIFKKLLERETFWEESHAAGIDRMYPIDYK